MPFNPFYIKLIADYQAIQLKFPPSLSLSLSLLLHTHSHKYAAKSFDLIRVYYLDVDFPFPYIPLISHSCFLASLINIKPNKAAATSHKARIVSAPTHK